MKQLSFFDVEREKSRDFTKMDLSQVADIIGIETSLRFFWNPGTEYFEASYKGVIDFQVALSAYTLTEMPFISCATIDRRDNSGNCTPCDSLDAAVEYFKQQIKIADGKQA